MKHLTQEKISDLCHNINNQNVEDFNHIKSCTSCRTQYNQALFVHERLRSLEHHQPSMRFAKNIIELIDQNKKLDSAGVFWVRIISISILFSSLLVLVLMIYWFMSSFDGRDNYNLLAYQWSMIFLVISCCAWSLYFFDKWLERSHYFWKFY